MLRNGLRRQRSLITPDSSLSNMDGQRRLLALVEGVCCVDTALDTAFKDGDYSIVDFNYAREALSRALGVPRDPEPLPNDPLAVPYWGRYFMEWNDAPETKQEDVLKLMKQASELAKSLQAEAMAK
jgi:hypothetical protein